MVRDDRLTDIRQIARFQYVLFLLVGEVEVIVYDVGDKTERSSSSRSVLLGLETS